MGFLRLNLTCDLLRTQNLNFFFFFFRPKRIEDRDTGPRLVNLKDLKLKEGNSLYFGGRVLMTLYEPCFLYVLFVIDDESKDISFE